MEPAHLDPTPQNDILGSVAMTDDRDMSRNSIDSSVFNKSSLKIALDIPANQHGIAVKIVDFYHREDKLNKYTLYTIRGNDNQGAFEVARRYSEFFKLRQALIAKWPGCYIPPLPSKNLLNNMDVDVLKDRKHGLNVFLMRIADLPYLHYSKEYQAFLRNISEVSRELKISAKIQYDEIITRYATQFQHLSNIQSAEEANLIISRFKSFLIKMNEKFKSFRIISKEAAKAKKQFYGTIAAFHNLVMTEYERDVIGEYRNFENLKSVFNDADTTGMDEKVQKMRLAASREESIEQFDNWLVNEHREIEALLEAIQQKEKYEHIKARTEDKKKDLTSDVENVAAGKFYWKSLFFSKGRDNDIADFKAQADACDKEVEQLTMLIDMMVLLLAYDEIAKFKGKKSETFYEMIDNAANTELNNLANLTDYWKKIVSNNTKPTEGA